MRTFKQFFNEMKISDFNKKLEELEANGFVIKPGKIAGIDVVLITPQRISMNWTKDNLIFRSSIWTLDGQLVSAGYKKFVNFSEKPELFPPPKSLKDTAMLDKIDGTCLIISKFHGELIHRTRGTFDAVTLDNGYEVTALMEKYPDVFENELLNSENYSIICEWLSPNNVIVIKYGNEPELILTGIIKHEDYSYLSQSELDKYAKQWNIKRPEYYNFSDIKSMLKGVQDLRGKEGLCLYYNKHQDILKVKSAEYLALHSFKNNLTPENMIDMYIEWNMPGYQEFLDKITNTFDYECQIMAQALVSKIVDAKKQADKILDHMKLFVQPLRSIPRKGAAEKIISAYGNTSRSAYAFSILNDKPLKKDAYKKLLLQLLDK